jgi:hypothetical protein
MEASPNVLGHFSRQQRRNDAQASRRRPTRTVAAHDAGSTTIILRSACQDHDARNAAADVAASASAYGANTASVSFPPDV